MHQLFFQVEQDYRTELYKLGRTIPAIADVSLDLAILSGEQRQAIEHLLRVENKFLNYERSDGVPAHDSRTLLMALTREAWCDPRALGRAWTPSARTLIPCSTTNRLQTESPPPYFDSQELRGLHLAYVAHAVPVERLVVDVDERVLLLLMLERAEQLENASQKQGYTLSTLLNKLVSLTLPEADTLWTALQTNCSARLIDRSATSAEQLRESVAPLCLPVPVPVPARR